MSDERAALFFLNDLAEVGGAAAATTGVPVLLGAHQGLRYRALKSIQKESLRLELRPGLAVVGCQGSGSGKDYML